MLMGKFLVVCFIVVCVRITAQENLIMNGDCEEYSSCPLDYSAATQIPYEITKCLGWHCPTVGTSDYLNRCNGDPLTVGVPINGHGVQEPFSGDGYLGAYVFNAAAGFGISGNMWWEYVTCTLSEPLEDGKIYRFSFYLSLAEYSDLMIDEIGAYFSDTIPVSLTTNPLEINPQIFFKATTYFGDTINWTYVEGNYVATGGEKYITIGNFKDTSETNFYRYKIRDYDTMKTYMYFDEFSLTQSEFSEVMPNVFTPNGDGINDFIDFSVFKGREIYIMNRWGNTIYLFNKQSSYLWYGLDELGNSLSDGVYYFIIIDPESEENSFYGTIYLTQ